MGLFNRKQDTGLKQMTQKDLLQGVRAQPDHMEQMAKAKELLGSLSPRDFLWGGTGEGSLADFGGAAGWGNESAFYAWYQILSAPWLQLPVGAAILNKVCNIVGSTPTGMRNIKTGAISDLPPVWDMPLGSNNPSYHRRQLLEDLASSLIRWGNAYAVATMGILDRDVGWEATRILVVDATRVQVCGSMVNPYYLLYEMAFNLHSSDLTETNNHQRLYPNGRPKLMLAMSMMRSPETLRGVPAGMLGGLAVRSALAAESFAVDAFGDWQQQLLSPKTADGVEGDEEHLDLVEQQIEDGKRVITSGREMVSTKLGMSAKEADLIKTRQADEGFIAQMWGIPKSTVASIVASFAQIEADKHTLKTDFIDPCYDLISAELTRLLPDGQEFWFDRSAAERGDPKTQTALAKDQSSAGHISVNEARDMLGREPYPEDEYNRPTIDKSRVFFDMLDELVEQQVQKNLAEKERGRPTGKDAESDPKADYPDVPNK